MYNSILSTNAKIRQITKDISDLINVEISNNFDAGENICYPSLTCSYLDIGGFDKESMESFNDFSLSITVSNQTKDWFKVPILFIENFDNITGLNRKNVNRYVLIPKLDYKASKTNPPFLENMRLKYMQDGWHKVPNDDENISIRRYFSLLRIFYKKDN